MSRARMRRRAVKKSFQRLPKIWERACREMIRSSRKAGVAIKKLGFTLENCLDPEIFTEEGTHE